MTQAINESFVVGDDTPDHLDPLKNPQKFGVPVPGLIERDYNIQPVYMAANPSEMDVIDMKEWPRLIADIKASGSSLINVRNREGPGGKPIPFLNQGSFPYCWRHSAAHAIMMIRALIGLPYVALSAFSLCPTVRGGGWAALAFEYAMKFGCSPQSLWPQGKESMSLWTPECQAAAAENKVTEGWWDLGKHAGLRKLTIPQVGTSLLRRKPVIVEYNDIAHSMLGMRLDDDFPNKDPEDPSRYGIAHLNSWLNYGDNGIGKRTGMKAWPDSSVSPTDVTLV